MTGKSESGIAKTIVLSLQWPLVELNTRDSQQVLLASAAQQATSVLPAQHVHVSDTALG